MSNYLSHSWGKNPEQKQREKEYNHEYYEKHKSEIRAQRLEKLSKARRDATNYALFKVDSIKSRSAAGTAKNEAEKAAKQYAKAHDNLWKYSMTVDALPVAVCESGKTFAELLINDLTK